jgi:predicted ATP-grasp superfamily ATP-dependent carboligase
MIRGHHNTRILLSEGSSLSGRQAITALGIAGYRVDVCDPDPVCLGRFSRFVRRFHRCPPMSGDPLDYLKFVVDLVARESFAVLLPTHEQAYLFASARDRLPSTVGVALSSFESFERVQSKAEFSRVLIELALPQPRTRLVSSALPLVWVAVWMLATPRAAHNISGTYASSHQLSGKAIKIIRDRYYAIKAKFRD